MRSVRPQTVTLRSLWHSFEDRGTARIVRLRVCRRSDQSLLLGHLSQPVQLSRKLGIAFKPCTECSDVHLALEAIVPFRFIEVLRAGVDWSASREVLIFQQPLFLQPFCLGVYDLALPVQPRGDLHDRVSWPHADERADFFLGPSSHVGPSSVMVVRRSIIFGGPHSFHRTSHPSSIGIGFTLALMRRLTASHRF